MRSNNRTTDSTEEKYVKMHSDLSRGPRRRGGGKNRKGATPAKNWILQGRQRRRVAEGGGVLLHSKGEEKEEQVDSIHSFLFVDTQAPKYKPDIPEYKTCESTFLSKPPQFIPYITTYTSALGKLSVPHLHQQNPQRFTNAKLHRHTHLPWIMNVWRSISGVTR